MQPDVGPGPHPVASRQNRPNKHSKPFSPVRDHQYLPICITYGILHGGDMYHGVQEGSSSWNSFRQTKSAGAEPPAPSDTHDMQVYSSFLNNQMDCLAREHCKIAFHVAGRLMEWSHWLHTASVLDIELGAACLQACT